MERDKRQTSVWLPQDLWQWLRAEAFNRGISQGELIRELLQAERSGRVGA